MGGFSLIHWLILGVIVLLLFGKGRFSEMMGDVAKGLKSFKKGMSEDDVPPPPIKHIDGHRAPDAPPPSVTPTASPTHDPESR
jgi:sec-independent protein translocase protein TatA